jgi:hypothetical protein
MATLRSVMGTCVLAVAMQGCAEPPAGDGDVQLESSDPQLAKVEGALDLTDEVIVLPPLSLCAMVSDTYDYAPWSKAYAGNARCVKQTTVVPEMGFGTEHETSASFPEFTGLNLVPIGGETPAQKCRKAGIRVTIRWTSSSGAPGTWSFEVPAVPKFAGPVVLSPDSAAFSLSRVVSCVATHTSGLGGHGPGQFTITTSPFTGVPVPFPSIAPLRPMTSRVEATF